MTPLFISVLLAAMCLECRGQKDNVLQPERDVTATEGQTETLSCLYNSSSTTNYLYWYKRDGNNRPEFILSRFIRDEGNTAEEFRERFSSTLDSQSRSVPLRIEKLHLSDSAVYYCALQPTVTGNSTSVSCEDLTPVNKEQFPLEDRDVTLSYKYSSFSSSDYFYWYRQYPGKPPEFLISHYGTKNETKSNLSAGVSGDKTQMYLQVSSAAVSDSAVYYCAVRPTVTGNSTSLYKNLWSKDNAILHNVH
ncbi:hypothetical protein Q5P01_022995 [Channa striata]|uniref:Ig-like domain-containing protein n=1 Tax=Channa striata TaxID=64152 RepID=A0AA88LS40_CHASR|nr:hypothetical protein Q5P01_022995 [Channa striata]